MLQGAAIKVDTQLSAALLHQQKSGRWQSGSKTGFWTEIDQKPNVLINQA